MLREIGIFTNDTRTKVPVFPDNFDELFICLFSGSIRINVDGQGFCDTNSIRELNKSAPSKTSSDKGFG